LRLYGVKVSDTKEKILAATRRLLEDEGAAAVSMRRIAAECQVSAMAPYWYFPNREALLEACSPRPGPAPVSTRVTSPTVGHRPSTC
jgi:AcrR family transcriptional regulator